MRKRKISQRDINTILKAGKIIDRIAQKYGISGNLAQVYIEAYNQFKGRLNQKKKEI